MSLLRVRIYRHHKAPRPSSAISFGLGRRQSRWGITETFWRIAVGASRAANCWAPIRAPREIAVVVTSYAHSTLRDPVVGLRSRRLQVRTLSGILIIWGTRSLQIDAMRCNVLQIDTATPNVVATSDDPRFRGGRRSCPFSMQCAANRCTKRRAVGHRGAHQRPKGEHPWEHRGTSRGADADLLETAIPLLRSINNPAPTTSRRHRAPRQRIGLDRGQEWVQDIPQCISK